MSWEPQSLPRMSASQCEGHGPDGRHCRNFVQGFYRGVATGRVYGFCLDCARRAGKGVVLVKRVGERRRAT